MRHLRQKFHTQIKLLLELCILLSLSFHSLKSSNAEEPHTILPITKDQSITINLKAGRLSDIELKIDHKSHLEKEYKEISSSVIQNSSQGNFLYSVELKTNYQSQPDNNDENCISSQNDRRIGICNDGFYKIHARSIDAAGNSSDYSIQEVERDTVSPSLPNLSEVYKCGANLCIKANGEDNSFLVSNSSIVGQLSRSQREFVLAYNWEYLTEYKFELQTQDRATNLSAMLVKKIIIPIPLLSRGGLEGTSTKAPYADKAFDSTPINLSLKLKYGSTRYEISKAAIPAPILTYIYTHFDNKVSIYGIGIPKNHKIRANISTTYLTYNEAKEYCGVGWSISSEEEICMEKAMNIESLDELELAFSLECIGLMLLPPANLFCENNKKKEFRVADTNETKEFEAKNVMVSLLNEYQNNKEIGTLWNDNSDGRFKYSVTLGNEVNLNEFIKAKVAIFGSEIINGIALNYDGLSSEFGNSLMVEKAEFINLQGKEAKVLDVPYFNQYLEPDGSYYPEWGWVMCGAASSVMTAGYFNKLEYDRSDEHSLKKYMYSDNGQGIEETCGYNRGGAFGLTNLNCNQNSRDGIVRYLKNRGLNYEFYDGFAVDINGYITSHSPDSLTFEKVKESIDAGKPLILSFQGYGIGHIFVIKGYTSDGFIIVNDSYKDVQNSNSGYSYNGMNAIYKLEVPWKVLYAIQVL